MPDTWLEIDDGTVDVAAIMAQIRHRLAQRDGVSSPPPAEIAADLRREMLGDPGDDPAYHLLRIRQRDADIVPRNYKIDHRIPILGPIHSVVRKLINDEIRRFLFPSLNKQARFNRQILAAMEKLAEENARLRAEVDALRKGEE